MTQPRGQDLGPDGQGIEGVTDELRRYLDVTEADPSPGFAGRVMDAVAGEPIRRPGLLARIEGWPGFARRGLQVAALAAVLVLAVGGTLVGGRIAGLLRPTPAPGASPTALPSPVATPTPTLSPSPSPRLTAPPRTSATPRPAASAEASGGGGSASGTPDPSVDGSGGAGGESTAPSPTPQATASDDH
ncbi:MAG TPA: hypothetical protein VKU35_05020 [Candidatus Limnocylindria bacterium]|nr:hypothetical protein [Candidatus Limnocylindria bacterium]